MTNYKVRVKVTKTATSELDYLIEATSQDEAQDIAVSRLTEDRLTGDLVFESTEDIKVITVSDSELSKEDVEDLLAYEARIKEIGSN